MMQESMPSVLTFFQTVLDPMFIAVYNLFYTSQPVLALGGTLINHFDLVFGMFRQIFKNILGAYTSLITGNFKKSRITLKNKGKVLVQLPYLS
jgi:hypothetical protein